MYSVKQIKRISTFVLFNVYDRFKLNVFFLFCEFLVLLTGMERI